MWVGMVHAGVCILLSVAIHLFTLRVLWRYALPRFERRHNIGLALMVLGAMVAHYVEISIFATGIVLTAIFDGDANVAARGYRHDNLDMWYYSAAFFTSLGEDRPPSAGLRFLATSETLTGLILITWTASFLFLVMQSWWGPEATSAAAANVAQRKSGSA